MALFGAATARRWLDQLLHTHDTPHRTAAAFAVGVFFGFSPFLGLHTILGVIFAFAFNLNRIAVLLGVYSNLPWILPAYYTLSTMAGAALLRVDVPPDLLTALRDSLSAPTLSALKKLANDLAPLLWAFLLGSTIGALGLAVIGYRAALAMIVSHRRRQCTHQTPEVADK